jgi:methionine-S-sulfoxide reductase
MFGMGCFWGAERKLWELGKGIHVTAVGYAAGLTTHPTYEEVCSGRTGHNEVVLVVYDPKEISYERLLKTFWESHDPTQGMRQGNDTGTQYRSGIYVFSPEQRKAAEPTAEEKLAKLEQSAPTGKDRFYALPALAKAAFEAGEFDKAERYARELLAAAPGNEKDWNYGNAIFFGNMIFGRVALRRDGNVGLAKTLLLSSGATPGSPQLNSFGPNMSLAKDLLAAGERDTVLEFFTRCRLFWSSGQKKLDEWTATVRGGGTPEFGANLLY